MQNVSRSGIRRIEVGEGRLQNVGEFCKFACLAVDAPPRQNNQALHIPLSHTTLHKLYTTSYKTLDNPHRTPTARIRNPANHQHKNTANESLIRLKGKSPETRKTSVPRAPNSLQELQFRDFRLPKQAVFAYLQPWP